MLPVFCQSQSWELQSSFAVNEDITAYSFDDRGAIYVGTKTGTITKYAADGTNQLFAYPNSGSTTLIEGRNTLLPFMFFRDNQQAIVLDRFMSNPVVYDISSFASSFAWLATPGLDRHIWLLRSSPLTIEKVDPLTRTIVQSTPLLVDFPLKEVVFFKAQRNLLLIVDNETGVWIFDLFGNPIMTVEQPSLSYAHIDQSELVLYADGKLIRQQLSKDAQPTIIQAPVAEYQTVIRRGANYHFIGRRQVDTYQLSTE